MSWGHATSPDLVHWTEQPLAIPQDDTAMIFSGAVVDDRANSSGLGTADNPPLVAVYTCAARTPDGRQTQSLAYSLDGGTSWTKYRGNPVLDIGSSDFRDPKVFRNDRTGSWLMAVALSDRHQIRFYSSHDLKSWTALSEFGPAGATGGVWECPDLFPLAVDGDPARTKWVLTVSTNGGPQHSTAVQYFIGVHWTGWDVGEFAGRRATIRIVDSATGGWGHLMVGDLRLSDQPARPKGRQTAVNLLVDGQVVRSATGGNSEALDWTSWDLADLVGRQVRVQVADHASGGWGHVLADQFTFADAPALGTAQRAHWLDHGADFYAATSVDDEPRGRRMVIGWMNNWAYADKIPTSPWRSTPPRSRSTRADGTLVLTDQVFPDPSDTGVALYADGGAARAESLTVRHLRSSWRG